MMIGKKESIRNAGEVCLRRGWEPVKQPIEWNSKDMELETGAIDKKTWSISGREPDKLMICGMEMCFYVTFVDIYSDNAIIIPVRNHTALKQYRTALKQYRTALKQYRTAPKLYHTTTKQYHKERKADIFSF